MSRKMLINVLHPEEARVAIVQDGRLMDLNIEISGKEQTKGNIFKGVVLRVEPGLQAAFVDIGHKKPGFIQMGDLHPDSWQWREDIPEEERKRRPRIQDILRRGQELLVQVEKDARDMKGSALTGYLSLPGRYMVLMPGDKAAGISRKIEDNAVRKELKSLVAELQVPDGYGYIVRTEAAGRSVDELKKDLEYLIGVHEKIVRTSAAVSAPAEIYKDAGVILRTIRDYFSDDIDEVLVDDKEACQQAIEFFKEIMPGCENRVKLHREKRPIFSKYQLEEQIDQLYEKRVQLPSGGSLVIEPTEALVSIDVNSGKSSGERGVEDTAFKTNQEAAAEVARQLRLRDLGGLVVIDFIDMRDNKHNKEVERTLKDALKMDKARVNLGRISTFGMLEMSRQRIAKNINDAIHLECPHCEGRGRVKSVESMALSFLRKVHGAAAKGQLAEVRGSLPLEVAYYLLNRKKRELAQIENDYEIVVTIKGKPSFLLNQLELEVMKREKPDQEERQSPSEVSLTPEPVSEIQDQGQPSDSAGKKKRKRRKKKKGTALSDPPQQQETLVTETDADAVIESSDSSVGDQPDTEPSDGVAEEPAKKRRRSRPRKKKPAASTDTAVVDVSLEPVADKELPITVPSELPPAKPKARGGRKKPTVQTEEQHITVSPPDETEKPAAKPKTVRGRAKTAKKTDVINNDSVAGTESALPEEARVKKPGQRRPKKPAAAKVTNEE